MIKPGYFEVRMDKTVKVGSGSFDVDLETAIIDTGTSLIIGPYSVVNAINQKLGARKASWGEYVVDCERVNRLPQITVMFGGQPFPLSPQEYILKQADSDGAGELCITAFMQSPHLGQWVIGDIFLKHFYVEYDLENHRVGFALKK